LRKGNAVVRAGSIRRTAESLHITPSALDRRVLQIEEELDVAIFKRHAKGMRLTAAEVAAGTGGDRRQPGPG